MAKYNYKYHVLLCCETVTIVTAGQKTNRNKPGKTLEKTMRTSERLYIQKHATCRTMYLLTSLVWIYNFNFNVANMCWNKGTPLILKFACTDWLTFRKGIEGSGFIKKFSTDKIFFEDKQFKPVFCWCQGCYARMIHIFPVIHKRLDTNCWKETMKKTSHILLFSFLGFGRNFWQDVFVISGFSLAYPFDLFFSLLLLKRGSSSYRSFESWFS